MKQNDDMKKAIKWERTASKKLCNALRKAGASEEMISLAAQGYYGDFTSPLATPILQLISDCRAEGLESVAKMAMKGDFDG